ncbi:MAG: propane monooxygenase reductase component [Bacteroidales bacterium]|nr:propane monooxygenase reductase component [Bacteroidales bacterium]
MLAKKYKSLVKSINNPFEGIYTVEFVSLSRSFKYHPGQFLHLALDNDYDGIGQWPESRCFSMQSNPIEDSIRITYAVKGEFTRQMKESLKVGSEVWLKLPYGDLFQRSHNKENAVFIAGGTGITPFLSLFNNASFKEYSNPKIYLGFRNKAYNIYENELKAIQSEEGFTHSNNIKIFYQDLNGLLDIDQIISENKIESNYFISGPPVMIKSFKKRLVDNGVPEENILTDDWE